jgi:hypothetical protein
MPALTEYRLTLARALAGYEARGVLAPSGQRLVSNASTTSGLVEARWPLLSPRVLRTYAYDSAYLLRPAAAPADQLRLVASGGLNSQTGTLTPDADWTAAPTVGEAYELHLHGIEPVAELTDLLNAALKVIWLKVDVGFTPVVDAKGAYVPALDAEGNALGAWLTDELQVLELRYTPSFVSPSGWINAPAVHAGAITGRAYRDGDRLYLAPGGGPVGTMLYATVKKPAFWHCRDDDAGAYGEVAGLAAGWEMGEGLPYAEWVVDGAIALAWERNRTALEAAVERRRDKYLQEAVTRFGLHQENYWRANPPVQRFATAPRTLVATGGYWS